ncbi:MAG: DNA replication and repair protein RecF [Muribaculaceae bacterium]|nr:DNA replication and repair protein RecF [Muribaculaceae bacterium]
MRLNSLQILNYKNIAEARLDFSPKVNCLIGNNGMGKTNVLDAIYYLSMCKSHMNQADSSVIMHDAPFMMLQGHYTRRGVDEDITISLQRGKRKVVRRGGKEYQRLSQHIGMLPIVMIAPLDWDLIRGGGEERRRLMDTIISQSDKDYLEALIRYNKAVEHRNSMIRNEMRDPLLYETVEQVMCDCATRIHSTRARWVERFTPIFMEYYRAVAGDGEIVHMTYESHLNNATMLDVLNACRERDMILGYTTRGVHRDDIDLLLGDHPMRRTGSQGQCKTYTIALRLAQFDFIKAESTTTPILLLDDIFDRLDAHRVERIIDVVSSDRFGQIFITDTNRTHLDEIIRRQSGDYRMMTVANGEVIPDGKGGEA